MYHHLIRTIIIVMTKYMYGTHESEERERERGHPSQVKRLQKESLNDIALGAR